MITDSLAGVGVAKGFSHVLGDKPVFALKRHGAESDILLKLKGGYCYIVHSSPAFGEV